MKEIGINLKRLIICVLLGLLSGIICAVGSSILQPTAYPVGINFIIYIIYNRIILGFMIGLIEDLKIIKSKMVNSLLRGALFGALVSTIMVIIPELASINFLVVGILFGILIDLIASKLAPAQS
jgi:hypothetical protein